jgi:hypothetical protein
MMVGDIFILYNDQFHCFLPKQLKVGFKVKNANGLIDKLLVRFGYRSWGFPIHVIDND